MWFRVTASLCLSSESAKHDLGHPPWNTHLLCSEETKGNLESPIPKNNYTSQECKS